MTDQRVTATSATDEIAKAQLSLRMFQKVSVGMGMANLQPKKEKGPFLLLRAILHKRNRKVKRGGGSDVPEVLKVKRPNPRWKARERRWRLSAARRPLGRR